MSARTDEEAEQVQASSGITPESLSSTLKAKLEAEHVDISDLSGIHTHPAWLALLDVFVVLTV